MKTNYTNYYHNKNRWFYKFILFLLVVLPIYQDSPLSKYFGAAGYTIIMPLSLILFAIYFVIYHKIPKNPEFRRILYLGFYLVIISYVAVIVWLINGGSVIILNEDIFIKAFKVILQYFSYVCYVALVIIICNRIGYKLILKYSYFVLILLTIICLIEKANMPYAFEGLHFAGSMPYYRIRLLTLESSWTSTMIFIYGVLAFYYALTKNSLILKIIAVVCDLVLIVTTTSKTLLLMILVMAVFYFYYYLKERKIKKTTAIILLVALFVFGVIGITYVLPKLVDMFAVDIKNFTSVATRTYTIFVSTLTGIKHPFGVGASVYLEVYKNELIKNLSFYKSIFSNLNYSEINGVIASNTDANLVVTSGVMHYNLYWGIIGTVYLVKGFINVYKKIENEIIYSKLIKAVYLTMIIFIIFGSHFSFEFWLLFSFVIVLEEYTKKYKLGI